MHDIVHLIIYVNVYQKYIDNTQETLDKAGNKYPDMYATTNFPNLNGWNGGVSLLRILQHETDVAARARY